MSSRTPDPLPPAADLAAQVPGGGARWAEHREALLAARDRLQLALRQGDSIQRAAQQAAALPDKPVAPIPALPGLDPLDGERSLLVEVEAALKRLEQGVYGRCVITGRPIAEERLRLFPWIRNA
jgi:RNA polymerase-binding transcription factor DksA